MNTKDNKDEERLLELLDVVGRRSDVSQRHLARHMGVALGLANSYLKRCIRKGLIKIGEAPANRYLYYLTPKGFTEKSRLTAKYLSISFDFYRQASQSCANTLSDCRTRGWRRIALCGVSDLAEIMAIRMFERDLELVGTYDPEVGQQNFLSRPVWRELPDAKAFDGIVLTDLQNAKRNHERLASEYGAERVVVPDILRL